MVIFKSVSSISLYLKKLQLKGVSIGFVPTMGALHLGHISLITASKQQGNCTVTCIFVNPTQFNDQQDFQLYPITTEKDIEMLSDVGCDILFLPSVDEMYPTDYKAGNYELGTIESVLEGKYRQGHFQGVCQIIDRLLSIISPQQLYLGQKDFQQCMVIKKLIQLKNLPVELIVCPTLRATNGLALSSRNTRLTDEGRIKASIIYQSMLFAKENLLLLPLLEIEESIREMLIDAGFSAIDYVSICDVDTLMPAKTLAVSKANVILIAAFLEKVRLIDNMLLT